MNNSNERDNLSKKMKQRKTKIKQQNNIFNYMKNSSKMNSFKGVKPISLNNRISMKKIIL